MNLSDYQPLAAKTMNADLGQRERIINCALGLAGEVGELAEALYPASLRYTQKRDDFSPEDRDYIVKELGDLAWYSAVLADSLGQQLADHVKFDLKLEPTFKASQGWAVADRSYQILLQKVGFVVGQVKWYAFHGHELTAEMAANIVDSLVDVVFQLHQLSYCYGGVTLLTTLERNIEKLQKWYPDGQFSTEASVNRAE